MPHVVNRVSSIVGKWVRHSALVLSSGQVSWDKTAFDLSPQFRLFFGKTKQNTPHSCLPCEKSKSERRGVFFCCTGHMGPASALGIWRNLKLHKCTKHWKKLDNWGTSLALIFLPSSFSSSKKKKKKKDNNKKRRPNNWVKWMEPLYRSKIMQNCCNRQFIQQL